MTSDSTTNDANSSDENRGLGDHNISVLSERRGGGGANKLGRAALGSAAVVADDKTPHRPYLLATLYNFILYTP